MNADLRDQLVTAIELSVETVAKSHPGDPVVRYALCTDEDIRSVYSTACTASMAEGFGLQAQGFWPAEWCRVEHYKQFSEANTLLERLADEGYAAEGDDVPPDADHLRPWKGELFAALVAALSEHRERGTFGPGVLLLAMSHDPGDWLEVRIDAATKSVNSPELYSAWRAAWDEYVGKHSGESPAAAAMPQSDGPRDDIVEAAESSDVERAVGLLAVSSPRDVVQAFTWFAEEGNLSAMEGFLEYGVSIDSLDFGATVLKRATSTAQTEVVRFLVQHGASLQGALLVGAMDSPTPSLEIAQVLLDAGANPNQGYRGFPTPLAIALVRGNQAVAKYLKDRGATALEGEGEGPHPDWIEERATDLGVPRKSLPAWIEAGEPEYVIPLLTASPVGLELQRLAKGHGLGIRFEQEPDIKEDLRNVARLPSGKRTLDDAALQAMHDRLAGHRDSAGFFTELRMLKLEIVDGTLQTPSPVPANQLELAGVLAARAGSVDTLSALLQRGLSVDARHCGTSLLENAAASGRTDVVRFLLDRGTGLGGIPLVKAAHMHRLEVVEMLLDAGADPDQGHPGFASPLGMALHSNRNLVAKYLIERGARLFEGALP